MGFLSKKGWGLLRKMDNKISNKKDRIWLGISELSDYLGISISLIRKMLSAGKIPFRRLPLNKKGKILFNKRQIDLWVFYNGRQNISRIDRKRVEVFL